MLSTQSSRRALSALSVIVPASRAHLLAAHDHHRRHHAAFQRRRLHGPNPLPYKSEIVHDMVHFKTGQNAKARGLTKTEVDSVKTWDNPFQHSVWTQEEVDAVTVTHRDTKTTSDRLAYNAVQFARKSFDLLSGYHPDKMTKDIVLNRAIFLETVAGCPGMVGGMLRHLSSLRNMRRDHGWIHTLLEEAENERMHLLTFVQMKQPGPFFRTAVVGAQGVFMTAFVAAYMIYPPFCHRFVGYLEEEAVHTYTDILRAIDSGQLDGWCHEPAPQIAIDYWHMRPGANVRDLMLVVRADEANHREVNHTFADISLDAVNPYILKQQENVRANKRSILESKQENKEFVQQVLRQWDESRTGALKFEELRAWLSAISGNREISTCEVKWVMSMAARDKTEDYTKLSLTPELFAPAAEAFLSYNTAKPTIDELMEEYDMDKSGTLNRSELAQLLKALNENIMPADKDIDWVMDHADVIGNGVITRPELSKAISLWYLHHWQQSRPVPRPQTLHGKHSKHC
jgi:Ca2+-binding EF-hand superfamily protein